MYEEMHNSNGGFFVCVMHAFIAKCGSIGKSICMYIRGLDRSKWILYEYREEYIWGDKIDAGLLYQVGEEQETV